MTFAELEAPAPLLRAIAARGYSAPTPVQEAVLAPGLRGRDLLVSSRTGSGKTIAFGFLLGRELLPEGTEVLPPTRTPLALVVAPTRELAMQVSAELQWLLAQTGARIATCVGGTDMGLQLRAIKAGAHVVVGTPGRLVDHLERKSLQTSGIRAVVLDEADEMLDMGFREELERILRDAPKERRTLLFSATIPTGIESLARTYQIDAARVQATPPRQAHQDIEVRAHLISSREREHAVVNCLRAADAQGAIVFCGTRDNVNHLHASLAERGFAAVALSGELTQPERTRALKALRDGRAKVLVATDVAARGLDLPDVGIVIQADLPQNAEVFQHRSGRTGRAGKKGVSVLLVPAGSQRTAERILHVAAIKAVWSEVPGPEEIRAKDRGRLLTDLAALAADPAEDDLEIAKQLLQTTSAEALAAALVKARRGELPAPEELPLTALVAKPRAAAGGKPRTHPSARHELRPHELPESQEAIDFERPASSQHPGHRVPAAMRSPGAARPHTPREHSAARTSAPREHAERAHLEKSHAPRVGAPARQHAPTHQAAHPSTPHPREGSKRDHSAFAGGVWFSVNVGHSGNADARWLLPIICRRGGVVKDEIGAIRVQADDTRFQVTADAARRFELGVARPDKKDPNVRFTKVKGKS